VFFFDSKMVFMNISPEKITGLILAGGRGRRVDNQDKGLLCLKAKPMIEHQLEWFSQQVDNVIISANRNIKKYESYGFPVIQDANLNETFPGPLEGLLQALKNCSTEWLFVQPVDMPMMPNDTLKQLCRRVKTKQKAYYLQSTKRSHYLSMLISKKSLSDLSDYLATDNRRVRGFLNEINAEAIELGLDEKCFDNLNELSDYL